MCVCDYSKSQGVKCEKSSLALVIHKLHDSHEKMGKSVKDSTILNPGSNRLGVEY